MSSTRFTPPVPKFEARTGLGDTTTPDGDGIIEPGDNDYSTANRQTLRSYISSLTKGVVPTEDIVEYNGPNPPPHANPFPLNDLSIEERGFSDQSGLRDAAYRDGLPGSPLDGALIEDIVKTGPLGEANDSVELSGHELLSGVVGSDAADGAVKTTTAGAKAYVSSIGQALSNKNLYSGNLTVDGGDTFDDRSFTVDDGAATSKRVRLGVGSLGSSYDVSDVKLTDVKDLGEIGRNLMVSAMGVEPAKYEDFNQWLAGPGGISQLEEPIRVAVAAQGTSLDDLNRTMANGGQDAITSDDGLGNTDGRYASRVWPVPFSPDATFTGATTSQAAFAAFVTGGTFVAAVLAAAVIGLIPGGEKGDVPAEVNSGLRNPRKLKSGKFKYEPADSLLGTLTQGLNALSDLTGLSLQNPIYMPTNKLVGYGDCVVAGLASFLGVSYGIDPSLILDLGIILNGNTAVLLGEITARILVIYADSTSRQYYMGIIRELNRDTAALGSSIENFGSAVGAAALDIVGIGSGPSIFDSKLFKFVNTLAQIGDLAYTQAAAIDYRKTDLESDPDVVYANFDPLSNTGGQKVLMQGFGARRVYGDKIKNRRGTSYALYDLPSYHLVPSDITQSYRSLLDESNSRISYRIKSVTTQGDVNGRLRFSPEQVSAIESTLDAEYMPFYFQDLRTNEIIAFHAFLEDLSDSYTANYNSAGGYGRIEEVKTYKDTKRSVGFSFNIVAMNPDDFDYMWWQINKLTTMVYPQWSKGRDLTAKVGTTSDFKFTQPFSQIPTATPVVRVRIGDLIRSNYSRFNLKRIFGYQDKEKKQSTATAGFAASTLYTISPGVYATFDGKHLVELESEGTAIKDPALSGEYYDNIFRIISGEGLGLPIGKSIIVDPEKYSKAAAAGFDASADVTSFYDPENNAIVRSFETTRGLGLAGVVTQLQFTWMDQGIVWGAGEDGPGNRAPRACKVQVSLEPIHDIAPGLDHEGFNRAPIYPIGNLINSVVEGGDSEPYGAGTQTRTLERGDNAGSKVAYEEAYKQSVLQKLF
jgi:hypothetical protein